MKNMIMLAAAALILAWVGPASAQDEQEAQLMVSPVETFTCNYNEGKGPADLKKAIDGWNKWMDSQDHAAYGAITITPYYFGEGTFDVGWLGFWTDGAAMGAGTDNYLATGGDAAAGFADAVSCDSHSGFASTMIKSPGDGPAPDKLVMYFSDCNVKDGADFGAVMDGLRAWGDYMTEQEYNNGLWIMFPAFGSGDMEFDFKQVTAFESHAAAGTAWDKYGNGGGWQKRQELLGDKLSCNVSRVYNGTFQRKMPPPEE